MSVKVPKICPEILPPMRFRNSPPFSSLVRRVGAPFLDDPNPQEISRSPARAALPVS